MLNPKLFSITLALQLSATLCTANAAVDNLYLLDPASLEGLLEHHYPAAQPALTPSPAPYKVHYARQDPEDTIVTNSGVEETLSFDDIAPPHTPSPPASLSVTLSRDVETSDRPRTVAGPPIPLTTTSTSSAPPSLPTVCPACPDYTTVTLADGSKCEPCLRDGSRGSWRSGVSCQSVLRNEGTIPDSSDDGRPTACLGTGDTPNTRTCLEGCNSMLLLARSANPCSPNIINAANTCKNCVSGGAILTSLDGSGQGSFANNFDSYIGSLRNWCASAKKIVLDTGRSLDGSNDTADKTGDNKNDGGDGNGDSPSTRNDGGPSSSSSSVRPSGNARNAAVTQVSTSASPKAQQADTTLTTSTTYASSTTESPSPSTSTSRSTTSSPDTSINTVTVTEQSISTSTAISVVTIVDNQGQASLSTSTTLATITASIATSNSIRVLGPQRSTAPTSSPGQSGEGHGIRLSGRLIALTVLGVVTTLAYL